MAPARKKIRKKASSKSSKKAAKKKPAAKKASKKKTIKSSTKKKKNTKKNSRVTSTRQEKSVPKVSSKEASKKPEPTTKKSSPAVTTFVQHVFLKASPAEVFDALVVPKLTSHIIGAECTGAPVVGGKFTAWNNYCFGKHLELVRGEKIVQEWSNTEWPKGAPPSQLEFQLVGVDGGTELTLTHSLMPVEQAESCRQGWIDYYWNPMRAHFS